MKMTNLNYPTLSILHLNCQSIKNESKILQLNHLTSKYNSNLICLNETFLKPIDAFNLENFNIHRKDRINKKGGGVILGIKKDIESKNIKIPFDVEAVGAEITINKNIKLAIFSYYSSPKCKLDLDFLNFVTKNFPLFILTGDLNAKHADWYCNHRNGKGQILSNFLSTNNLDILNSNKPTYPRSKSILDLTFCSKPLTKLFQTHDVLKQNIGDHKPTITTFKAETVKNFRRIKKIDWQRFKEIASANYVIDQIKNPDDLEKEADNILSDLKHFLSESTKTFEINVKCENPIQVPKHILDLIKFKNKIRRLSQKTNAPIHKTFFNMIERNLNKKMSIYKQQNVNKRLQTLNSFNPSNPKHWKIITNMDNEKPTLQKKFKIDNNAYTEDENEIANLFANDLELLFKENTTLPVQQFEKKQTHYSSDSNISKIELENAIKNLNNNASPGFDGITNKVIKNFPENFKDRILNFFNYSIKLAYIPKKSKVIMIPKKDKPPDQTSSYRPISLLNCLMKLLESIVNKKLQMHLELNNLIPNEQSGFRKFKSTQDHILRLTQSILTGFNKRMLTGAVFFDLEKAFDKAPHAGILSKLMSINLNQFIVDWIKNFLKDRSFVVQYNGEFSEEKPIGCGVPQGSCLSPTLFIAYFSDIIKIITNDVKVGLFADDLCIWYTSKNIKQIKTILQQTINEIQKFCTDYQFKINSTKTSYTVFTSGGQRKNYYEKFELNLTIGNIKLPLIANPEFLGIRLDPKLKFEKQINHIKQKMAINLNIIRKIKKLKFKNSTKLGVTYYKATTRSIIDYCHVIACTDRFDIIKKLQIIQNKALKQIRYFKFKTKTSTIHQVLRIEQVKPRLQKLFLRFMEKNNTTDSLVKNEITLYKNTTYLENATKQIKTPIDVFFEN